MKKSVSSLVRTHRDATDNKESFSWCRGDADLDDHPNKPCQHRRSASKHHLPRHTIWDTVKYPADFPHFTYVNPDAPKGGALTLSARGTFDSLHPFILKGTTARGTGMIYDTLMASSLDEPFTQYGLIAESVEVPANKAWVVFTLRQQARFHDGKPITADDVVFSFKALKEKGLPAYRRYYANVLSAEKLSRHKVKFLFDQADNRELPTMVGQLPILPAHYWQDKDFTQSTLDPPLGSGPYRIAAVDQGRSIRYERVADYWAKDLPVRRGQFNFDSLRYLYFRDSTVEFEAFKSRTFDIYTDYSSRNWKTGYDFPAASKGLVKKLKLPDLNPSGMQGFVVNTRRAPFKDPRVREALSYLWDFEWTNNNLSTGEMERITSYFENSELASRGLPTGKELDILSRYRDQLPERLFTQAFVPPSSDGSGFDRSNLRKAMTLFNQAGWHTVEGRLLNANGEPFEIEFLEYDQRSEGNIAAYIQNLNKLGIQARIRLVDTTQYVNRVREYDFDSLTMLWGQSLSPGNEQRYYWGSTAGQQPGSRNLAGINDPVVDALIEALVQAPDRDTLVATTRALDRVLLWGFYVTPQWHYPYHRVAVWDRFAHPPLVDTYAEFPSRAIQTWWSDLPKRASTDPSTSTTEVSETP